MHSDDALAIMLPPGAANGDGAYAAHWWRIVDGRIIDSGDDWVRTGVPHSLTDETHVVGFAPAADVALHPVLLPAMTAKQALAAARHAVAERSVQPVEELHVVPAAMTREGAEAAPGITLAAAASRVAMDRWTQWARDIALPLHSAVPAALLLDIPEDREATLATIAGQRMVRTQTTAFPADDALIDALLPPDTTPRTMSAEAVEAAIIRATDEAPAELLQGPYAPRGAPLLTRDLLTRAARLVALILIVSLAILVVQLFRIHRDTQAQDDAAQAEAASVLNGPAPTIDQLLPRLDARLAELGGEGGRVTAPLSALMAAMEPHPTVGVDTLAWQGAGTLSVTIGAPQADDINAVLLALQADGYRITATARSGTDGRQLADITIRSGP
mgnify:CR=1 FL=1